MQVAVLASGSKGNSTYIELDDYKILIDIGVSCNYIEKKLKELDKTAGDINAVFITHTHSDHINGLITFYKKYKPVLYITAKMYHTIHEYIGDFEHVIIDKQFALSNIRVDVIKTSHDTEDSIGFLVNNKIVYITDTGYINEKYFELLSNKQLYILESNHDIEMLIDGKYPHHLKQRVLGDKGHLSNRDAAMYLSKWIGDETKYIVLAHLSDENNHPDVALSTLYEYIEQDKVEQVIVARQLERTDLIKL